MISVPTKGEIRCYDEAHLSPLQLKSAFFMRPHSFFFPFSAHFSFSCNVIGAVSPETFSDSSCETHRTPTGSTFFCRGVFRAMFPPPPPGRVSLLSHGCVSCPLDEIEDVGLKSCFFKWHERFLNGLWVARFLEPPTRERDRSGKPRVPWL